MKYITTILIMFIFCSCSSENKPKIKEQNTIKNNSQEVKDTLQAKEVDEHHEVYNDTLELRKTMNSIRSAIKSNELAAFNEFIHPQYGCYFVFRPGSSLFFDRIEEFTQKWKKFTFDIDELFKTIQSATIKFEDWPNFVDCGYEGFSKDGAFAKAVDHYTYLSDLNHFNQKEFGIKPNSEEQENIAKIEKSVKFSVIWTSPSLTIDFIKLDNKWYIGVINKGRFDCSG